MQENDPQVRVYNARDSQTTVKIELYDVESEPEQRVFDESQTLPPSEAHEYESMYDEGGLKRLVVRTEDGHENQHEMDVLPKSEWGDGRGYLSVDIEEERIEFDQALG